MYSNIYYALVNSQLNYGITLSGSMGSTSRLSSLFSAQKKCIRTLYRVMICFQRGWNPSWKHGITMHFWVM